MKKTICITGMDGTGKSTLIQKLAAQYPSCYIATIWDLMISDAQGLPFNSKKDIDNFLCSLTPDSRLLFLAHAMKYSIDIAMQSDKDVVIVDSYYYKYFAMEKALGADEKLIASLIDIFPVPEYVLELILPIDTSFGRKTNFSCYECGLREDKNYFKTFQKEVAKAWQMYTCKTKWHKLDATKSPNELLQEALRIPGI